MELIEKRTHTIMLRVTENEWSLIKAGSEKSKVAQWIRELVINHIKGTDKKKSKKRLQGKKSQVDPLVVRQLVGIGNNLNQIARHANQTGEVTNLVLLAAMQNELKQIRQVLSVS